MKSIEEYRQIDGNYVDFLGIYQEYGYKMYIVKNLRAPGIIVAEYNGMTAEGGDQEQAADRLRLKRIQATS